MDTVGQFSPMRDGPEPGWDRPSWRREVGARDDRDEFLPQLTPRHAPVTPSAPDLSPRVEPGSGRRSTVRPGEESPDGDTERARSGSRDPGRAGRYYPRDYAPRAATEGEVWVSVSSLQSHRPGSAARLSLAPGSL